jgi:SAM-dependent methyltransferase
MGKLFGLDTPDVERCRVLELGCGDGGNLIPAAFSLPGAQFVGVDLSSVAVARVREAIHELGLKNVEAKQADLCALSTDLGTFDYVIAHGVYSWVPPQVRDRLLALCGELLSPRGVAYVSYNAYPGCRLREVARDAVKFAGTRPEPPEKVADARKLLAAISGLASESDYFGVALRGEARRMAEVDDNVFFHDDLSECYSPVYLHEFVAHAARHGLQYLSDAEYADTVDRCVRPELARLLDEFAGSDVIRREQLADFARGRSFRRTLLCCTGVELCRPASPVRLRGLWIGSPVRPAVSSGDVEQFTTPRGATLSTGHPLARVALRQLSAAWPGYVRFEDLLATIGDTREQIGEFLLTAAAAGAVDFRANPPTLATTPGQCPLASALVHWQVKRTPLVTTLIGTSVRLEGTLARELLLLLDGTRDTRAIARELRSLVSAGRIAVTHAGAPIPPDRAGDLLEDQLGAKLTELARLGLLVQ